MREYTDNEKGRRRAVSQDRLSAIEDDEGGFLCPPFLTDTREEAIKPRGSGIR